MSFKKFLERTAENYSIGFQYVLHLVIAFIVIQTLIEIISGTKSNFFQILIALLIITHLLMWICWMFNRLGFFEEIEVKPKRKSK